MTLVLYSNLEIEEMEKLANDLFKEVPCKNLGSVSYKDFPVAYSSENLNKIVKIKSIQNKKKMSFNFYFPSFKEHYKNNPFEMISFLLGHEGDGSLLSVLIKEGLALELGSYPFEVTSYFMFMSFDIILTEKGLQQYEKVIEIVFEYISMMKRNGLPEYLVDELKASKKMNFEFQSKSDGTSKAMNVSCNLHDYPPQYINNIHYLLEDIDPEFYQNTVDQLTADNLLIMLSNNEFNNLESIEPIYNSSYQIEKIRSETVEKIKNILSPEYSLPKNLHMPHKNTFIPENFDLLKNESSIKEPQLIDSSECHELFYVQDFMFDTPKVNLKLCINLPEKKLITNHENNNIISMFQMMFLEYVRNFKYEASTANIDFSLTKIGFGLKLTIQSYSDKLDNFYEQLSQKLVDFCDLSKSQSFIEEIFNNMKDKRKEKMHNLKMKVPYTQFYGCYADLIFPGMMTPDDIIQITEELTLEKYLEIHTQIFDTCFLECLITGNMSSQQAKDLNNIFMNKLKTSNYLNNLDLKDFSQNRSVKVENHQTVVFMHTLQNENEKNNLGVVLYQSDQNRNERHQFSIMSDLIKTPFFTEMRTNQQLGYVVFALSDIINSVNSLIFLVQSDKLLPNEINDRINSFIQEFKKTVEEVPDKIFEELKQGKISTLKQEFENFKKQSDFFMNEIEQRRYNYKSKEEAVKLVESFTKEQLIDLFKRVFDEQKRVIEIQMGNAQNMEKNRLLVAKRKTDNPNDNILVSEKNYEVQRKSALYLDPACKLLKLTID